MPITAKERKYLKNKHKGGKNNSKGALYESYYTVYQIALFLNDNECNLKNTNFSSQIVDTFVDDLLIVKSDGYRIYHQLKDVAGLRWNTKSSSYTLEYDFRRQKDISLENKEDFNLKLVYSDSSCDVGELPESIRCCAVSEYFPACQSINQLLLSFSPFKNAVKNITVPEISTDEELFGIAAAILGAWNAIEQKDVSLTKILDIVHANGKGYVNVKMFPTVEISDSCKNIFKNLGLKYHVNGLSLYWSYKNMNGCVPWSEQLEHKLNDSFPDNIWNLIELLS